MQAASITLTILLAVALVVLWRRYEALWFVLDEHAERLSETEQGTRNACASVQAHTSCIEELQERLFEHGLDHAPARKPAVKRTPATAPVVVPAAKKSAPAKAAAKKAPTKKATSVSAR